MPDFHLTTPVAFIIFNRPDTTERVFAEIAKARPPKLLVVGDGPRVNRQDEAEKVAAARAVVERVDWECEVLTNFSETNLGCKQRVSSGINWVFSQVEEAIILEDDCLPDQTFFRFCQELLERYRHDQRIGMISGNNFQFGRRRNGDSYYFSKYTHIWGWATWRDRWVGSYDIAMSKWPRIRDEGWLVDMVGNASEARYWKNIFESVYRGEIDTWDYQWTFANWVEGRLTILPATNLISNIGFGPNATHTRRTSELANMARVPMNFPLVHPVGVIRNNQADRFSNVKCFQGPFVKSVYNKLAGLGGSLRKRYSRC
ncbi:MAG TPA: glycosyltransferase family 2 protein [Thermosynechococcus sp. M3746_W2019_013]|uniref:glycosyltransferase family 2 protein n=1 Tax=Thermosynechococcus sp. M3746_W2019_013 TaxID=2747806 RepID=UPI001A0E6E6C|nr:glycosyltransferase family 2 protein [Thermosynechococcus sp. M3746_W2019_013]HIK22925.1 glycosyltransferase family 2 protein [Thermosynechococcus sp. M3746_W2019_013]